MKAEPIYEAKAEHGEGPVWCPIEQKFYFVDLLQGQYYKVDWNTQETEQHSVGQPLGVLAIREKGGIVVAVRDGFGMFDERSGAFELVHPSPEETKQNTRMNDGAVDPAGRFFAGTMEYDGSKDVGGLYRLDSDCTWKQLESHLLIPNGMGWSPDQKTYYLVDTFRHVMYAYDYDINTGNISRKREHIKWGKNEFPDGMTMDEDGGFWVAMWKGNKVSHFDANGKHILDIEVPAHFTTSCCFGGPDRSVLLITTSNLNLSITEKQARPLAGRCFAVQTNNTGMIEPRFKG